MKKLIIFLGIIFIALNTNAVQKITPGMDTVCCFFYKHYEPSNEDTIVLEPIALPAGCTMIGNWEDVGSTIYTHQHINNLVNEFCKDKYKKLYPSSWCHVERAGNTLFVIFKGKGSQELYALLNYEKFINKSNSYLTCLNK